MKRVLMPSPGRCRPLSLVGWAVVQVLGGMLLVSGMTSPNVDSRGTWRQRGFIKFGVEESLHDIQPTKSGKYVLCYKLSFYILGGPFYVSDDGYVVRKMDRSDEYFADPRIIEDFQKFGELPTPLPEYSLSNMDYFHGFTLEIIIVVGTLLLVGQRRWEKKNPARAAALRQPASAHKSRKKTPAESIDDANRRLSEEMERLKGKLPE